MPILRINANEEEESMMIYPVTYLYIIDTKYKKYTTLGIFQSIGKQNPNDT